MNESPTLVLGGTGSIGRRVAAVLAAGGHPGRVAARRGRVRFDWADPGTWEAAVAGVQRMFLLAPDGVPVDPAFVATAVDAGVRRIVLLSSRAIEIMGDQRLLDAERVVRESGADWTIIRPDWFDQNFDEGFLRDAVLAGDVVLPLGELRQAFVDAGDIAAVAAAALVEDGHGGRTYEPMGPRARSFGAAVEIISRVTGRAVRFSGAPEDYVTAMASAGVPRDDAVGAVRAFEALIAAGDDVPNDDVVRVTGRAPKDFETYVHDAAAAGVWRAG